MLDFTGSFTLFRMTKIVFYVSPLAGLDLFASDIETCKHVSASLGFYVIPLRGMTAAVIQYERKRSCCLTLHVILRRSRRIQLFLVYRNKRLSAIRKTYSSPHFAFQSTKIRGRMLSIIPIKFLYFVPWHYQQILHAKERLNSLKSTTRIRSTLNMAKS